MRRAAAVLAATAATAAVLSAAGAVPAGARLGPVPVRDGTYGDVFGDMLLFKVHNRRIIDPRIAVTLTCSHSDGTTQEVAYGPTSSDPDRRFRIARDGSGRIRWDQQFDGSLIEDAHIEITYTFPRQGRAQASVWVDSHTEDRNDDGSLWTSDCEGYAPFRLRRGPLNPG